MLASSLARRNDIVGGLRPFAMRSRRSVYFRRLPAAHPGGLHSFGAEKPVGTGFWETASVFYYKAKNQDAGIQPDADLLLAFYLKR